jgi:hypothetical protein
VDTDAERYLEKPEPTGQTDHTRCVVCKSQLIAGAQLCPVCKCYQARWKNTLYQYGAIGGFLTIAISLLTYVATALPQIRKTLFWKDSISVTAYNSESRLVIENSGDGELFVSHIFFKSERPAFTGVESVDKSIKEKSFLVHDIQHGTSNDSLSNWQPALLNDDQWNARINDTSLKVDCFRWAFFTETDREFQTMRAALKQLRTLPVNGFVVFYSGREGSRIEQQFPLRAVLLMRDTPSCKQAQ